MSFDETFKQVVETCAETRHEINSVLWKRMGAIQSAMAILFGKEKKWYAELNNAYHYREGGYPGPNSAPRHESAADKVAIMFLVLEKAGHEGLVADYLRNAYGLQLTRVSDEHAVTRLSRPDLDALKDLEVDVDLTLSDDALYKYLLDVMDNLQTEICQKADSIKIDSFEGLKEAFPEKKLEKGRFVRTVNAKALEHKSFDKAEAKKEKMQAQNELENELLDLAIE